MKKKKVWKMGHKQKKDKTEKSNRGTEKNKRGDSKVELNESP